MRTYPKVLSIAGSDCSGGAGIQADLKTFSALGVYGMTVITALTAQNTTAVLDIMPATCNHVKLQLDAIFNDIVPDAIKIGMLFNADIIDVVSERLSFYNARNIVLDPVMISTSGKKLISDDATSAMINYLMPLCDVVTPNRHEAEYISGINICNEDNLKKAANEFLRHSNAVLIKGGHFEDADMKDYLFMHNQQVPKIFSAPFVNTKNSHGTGCTLSSAIASYLALGYNLTEAVEKAKVYLTNALNTGADVVIGNGHGPVNHLWNPQKMNIKD